ncbi:hypothetical protein PanWU01x14_110240, partial [Parasponia andersonii]
AKIEKDEDRCGINRSELWSRGLIPKKGGHTEEIKEDYNQQFQEGNLEIDGSNDILTMALGTPEYLGREFNDINKHQMGKNKSSQPQPSQTQERVLPQRKKAESVKQTQFRFDNGAPASIRLLLNTIQGVDEGVVVNVSFDEEVFGEAFRLPIFKEDIIEFCTLQNIGAVPITLYM